MKKGCAVALGVVGAILIVAVIIISTLVGQYNSLVASRANVEKNYATIDVQLQRRSDLIPNLVSTVKGFNIQELSVIDSVTNARAKLAGTQGDPAKRLEAETELSGALSRLLVVVENYPEIKSNANYTQLMDELAGTENRIAVARIDYNEATTSYNTKRRSFPTSIIASAFNFEEAKLFEASEESKEVPKVEFN